MVRRSVFESEFSPARWVCQRPCFADLRIATEEATYVLGAPLDTPNQFFALPEEVDTLKFLQAGLAEYTYDPDGRLLYSEAAALGERDDYAYECP